MYYYLTFFQVFITGKNFQAFPRLGFEEILIECAFENFSCESDSR